MKNQLTAKKVIEDFKDKGTILSEEAEKCIDLFTSFQNKHLNYIMRAKLIFLSNLTASNRKNQRT
ncbi:MAG: hypothetical protein ACQUHE_03315 [Bacteroidia bacterium]